MDFTKASFDLRIVNTLRSVWDFYEWLIYLGTKFQMSILDPERWVSG